MGSRILVFLVVALIQVCTTPAVTNNDDFNALKALKDIWENVPPSWVGSDPCGSRWDGILCTNSRVTSITLASMGLKGTLSGDISNLSELQILDLSYNPELSGPLPPAIGDLKKLTSLILVSCRFSGPIPDTIGSLPQLTYLSLNSNGFTGSIPPSLGNLDKLYWLDLADNRLTGNIPVSTGTTPGLDLLVHTKHFHFGFNQLSGHIPPKLFSSGMVLIHVLLESNKLTGSIPSTLGLVKSLEVVRLDNNSLAGPVPSNINNLTSVSEMYLSNNVLTGPLPNLTGMDLLTYLDMSNNSFEATDFPPWFSTLQSLTTLVMETTQLQGQIPSDFFSLSNLQTVDARNNQLNGTLDIGTSTINQLSLIDLRKNKISGFTNRPGVEKVGVILVDNPVCQETGVTERYCSVPQTESSYSTPLNNCVASLCFANQISSPNCKCAFPYTGLLKFRAPSFSNLENNTYYTVLEKSLMNSFKLHQLPVDSVNLSHPRKDSSTYLVLNLQVFPFGQDRFNRTGISSIGFVLSNQTFKPPSLFGPFFFIGDAYLNFAGEVTGSKKSSNTGVIIGAVAGGSVLLLLLLGAGLYAHRQKKRAEKATEQNNPFAQWESNMSIGGVPQLKGARNFSFEELRKYSNNFSETNDIGSGGYGNVYRGVLPTGELIAIKRAQQGSMQGGLEFKTEIELLSRVHHKNVVSLLGFCFDRGEQMLVYEFVPNGSLMESLSGKTGIRLDWVRRLKVALGAARGLAYLHELANPPIIHRDIKSSNILLDERLNAKVADFGLSKPMGDSEKGHLTHVTTQVKGTMGYMDPEYYMTQQLTEKSDVYSFGVVMLELLTGKRPIEKGKYVVREVKTALDRAKYLYNLGELLDSSIGLDTTLKGLDKFVDVALKCVEENGSDRPTMGEVVKEIENILQLAGLNPNADSASTSASYDDASKGNAKHPYIFSKDAFDYSGGFPVAKVEPL
ncbi:PREDICTED: probable leucine-rich repeat receptor-like protein kinase At5g49770 isoform X1 [Populus euphratica]|uniref:non-specific serine/threonine protein kinase n=1 Tax=Populus euphratica TaxID=75702 RepID=A0AAJ6UFS8_POPEU|nr:PREDICTED: probable leucine-rich repeat receptor-like protein kinase At5g49770 isoform X1 [Populus euphratica]